MVLGWNRGRWEALPRNLLTLEELGTPREVKIVRSCGYSKSLQVMVIMKKKATIFSFLVLLLILFCLSVCFGCCLVLRVKPRLMYMRHSTTKSYPQTSNLMLRIKNRWNSNMNMYLSRIHKQGGQSPHHQQKPCGLAGFLFLIHTPEQHHFKDMASWAGMG